MQMDVAPNVTASEGPGLWNLEYVITCFADEKVCVSFGLWILSCLFWFTSISLHFYLRCKRKSTHHVSVFWHVYSFFGCMCNTIGALLSKQLTIQVITGSYMAAADVVHFMLTLFPVCHFKHRSRSDQRNSRKRKRHKVILSALSIYLFVGVGCYSFSPNRYIYGEVSHTNQRRLLGTVLQESTDIVGFTLGIIAVIVSWTVRVPVITKVCRGMVFSVVQIWAVFFSAMASIMYTAAIMSHNRHPEYFLRAAPWFLIFIGSAALDIALTILSCMMKNRFMYQMGFVVEATGEDDNCELLAKDNKEEKDRGISHTPEDDEENSNWTPLKIVPNRSHSNRASFDRCVSLSIEPVQQVGVGAVRLPGDGQTSAVSLFKQETLYYPDIPVFTPAHATHTKWSSPSSSDESSINTELEWDFEDLNQDWSKDIDVPDINPNDSSILSVGTETSSRTQT
ncbi:Hypothetical predicted protein [Pelobates cultripes]|uniref:Transmembrane protein 44 n=1 Tax=Pelobates cultripes TaxID=61616 RepID=A0AAD1RCH5_PELCU|nr:Hypothetical predicted protein [Pelobates cultripes]